MTLVRGELHDEFVLTENSDPAREFWDKSRFGVIDKGKVRLSLLEALYLLETEKMNVRKDRKKITFEQLLAHAKKREKNFWVRYKIYSDLRTRGYIIKTALKFGADFRVYDRGVKPGEDHAKWIVYPVHETDSLTWNQFAGKTRVAHSTRKKLLIGVLDDEDSITYYEIGWKRP